MVWFMRDDAVADSGKIRIIPRAKPADYVYTETEVITFESLVAKVEDVIAKANTAVDNATTAANKADEAALKANVASNKAAQAEVEIKASEARRVEAEQGRAEAEATRAANESKRTESFNTNITSWNSKVDAAVAKAQTATDNATTAANKAETAVSKLPLPLGNTLKGEVEATLVNVDDAYPAPLVTAKVMGQSNQQQDPAPSPENPQEITNLNKAEIVVTGKNLADVNESNNVNFILRKEQLPAGTYTFSCDKGSNSGFLFNVKRLDSSGNVLDEIVSSRTSPCTFTISEPMRLFINGWGLNAPYNIGSIQLEVGSKATAYEPTIKPKATLIGLKGNELCSLPNGVKDEVVIDAAGNVSLIKRIGLIKPDALWEWGTIEVLDGTHRYQVAHVAEETELADNAVCMSNINARCDMNDTMNSKDGFAVQGIGDINYVAAYIKSLANGTVDDFKAWLTEHPINIYYKLVTPQTIPLGKVELPALPESTSNVWNNGNIPASVYIQYLKDVNIAYGKLESQLSQMAMALSMMDTPTVIPEISEDEPTLIPELEESPIEESSITK